MTQRKSGTRGGGLTVDFTGVQEGGRVVPEGEYLAEVKGVERKTGNSSGKDYLSFEYKILTPGAVQGSTVYDNVSLSAAALWRFKQLLIAFGMEVPDGTMSLDIRSMRGLQVGLEIVHDEYKDKTGKMKTKSAVADFFHISEFEEVADDGTADDDEAETAVTESEDEEVDEAPDEEEVVDEDTVVDDEAEEETVEEEEAVDEEEDDAPAPPRAARRAK